MIIPWARLVLAFYMAVCSLSLYLTWAKSSNGLLTQSENWQFDTWYDANKTLHLSLPKSSGIKLSLDHLSLTSWVWRDAMNDDKWWTRSGWEVVRVKVAGRRGLPEEKEVVRTSPGWSDCCLDRGGEDAGAGGQHWDGAAAGAHLWRYSWQRLSKLYQSIQIELRLLTIQLYRQNFFWQIITYMH